ncbi:CHAT domain-containing protein [Candidatus Poribacteria bacterium]|nr:CHAT domain-containing protein [Candidatus Poribacteria bacterium]
MNIQELLTLLSETENPARWREILEQHRGLLNDAFIKGGIQQVEALTKEGRHTAALQLADGLVTACTVTEELAHLRGKALFAKAKALDGTQRWDDALAVYAEAQQLFEDAKDREGVADCDLGQGKIYYSQSDFDKTFACFQKAQAVYEELGRKDKAADCVVGQGSVHGSRGDFDKALACFQKAQTVFEELGMKDKAAVCLMNQGNVRGSRGEYDAALACYQRAQAVFEDLGIKKSEALCLMNQGNVHRSRGEYDAALACYQRAQAVFENLGIKDSEALCVMNQGNVHSSRGEYDAALACYQRAQAVFEDLGIRKRAAECVLNQGNVHDSRGEYDAALACYQRAQAVFEDLGIRDWAAECVLNQGEVHRSRGEYNKALACYQQVQAVFEKSGIKDRAALCVMSQGKVQVSRGEYDVALVCFTRAQAVFEDLGMKNWAMDALRGKGDVYRLRGEHDAALQCYTQAKEERPIDQLWYPEIQWQVRYGIAKLYPSTSQVLDYYDESIAIIDTLRGRQQTDWTKMGVLHNKEAVYAEAIQWCMDRKSEAVVYLPKAFNYTERAKARALLDLMDQTQPVLKSGDANVQTRLVLLRAHQREQGRLREAGQLSAAAELSAPIQQAQDELAELNFEDASLAIGRVRDIESIQKALPEDGALIEFYYQGETQVAFLLTKRGLEAFPLQLDTVLPNLPKLRQAIQERKPLSEVQATLAELFNVLFKQSGIWNHLEGFERLILVPHGELHGLPFAALYDEGRKQYLIEQKILSVVPSASILDVCRGKNPNRRESCLWIYAPQTKPDAELSSDEKMMREYGKPFEALSKRFKKLQPVTETAATIEGITELLRGHPWDIVYFYCHAKAYLDNPMLSFIELSDPTGKTPQVALLQAVDIFNLPLHASLVVLGACETAIGARRPGDDIVSLTRAFFRAGTPSVLSSLWRVPAHDTAALLNSFYSGWLSGADKAVALQTSQRKLLVEDQHPYYWAGFVLYGDWS